MVNNEISFDYISIPTYSIDAENVMNRFFSVEKIVYVEGEDDVVFWECVFNKIANYSVNVISVGGKKELEKYIEMIENNGAEYIVAKDSDYDKFKNIQYGDNIISTVGHSIENSLVIPEVLRRIIRNLSRVSTKQISEEEIVEWFLDTDNKLRPLLEIDILNEVENLGISVIPKVCERFMKSRTSGIFCEEKVKKYVEDLKIDQHKNEIIEIREKIKNSGLHISEIARGHFISSAAIKFITYKSKNIGKSVSMSYEAFFSNLISTFESTFNENHPHYKYYNSKINSKNTP
ncbi:DUF4435 domain-containing protein [Shewanella fodinae]|uniref:Uncharacterized protein DUF4435 n=1 Tax=Shewanella fodinae TaxID=552357 RepID=A0A4R2FJM9_9GAMM|nr:DUF4435 domain-containing protein [Shewanella fodinae]TCN90539.1 uncharacterized protein DUF4435 [Shewanella fodinae]